MENMEHALEKAFMEAYEMHADALFRHCYFKTSNRELAKDVVQEAFCRTWNYMSEGRRVENMRAFLYRVAGNAVIDEMRKRKTVSLEALEEAGFAPVDEHTPDGEVFASGQEAVRMLAHVEEPYRTALVMRYVEGLSTKEIAETLGETENVVSVRIHRGIKKLRSVYEGPEKV